MNNQTKSAKELVKEAFNQAQEAIAASVNLHIWGGDFNDTELPLSTFLDAWDNKKSPKFQYSMVEHVNHFRANTANLKEIIQHANLLERIRLFGEDGDLDIRRDGEIIYWHFISERITKLSDLSDFGAESYPANGSKFARDEQSYLLWRRDKDENKARVKHDWAEGVDFTHLKQVQYLENGRVAFVRYVAFEQREERKS